MRPIVHGKEIMYAFATIVCKILRHAQKYTQNTKTSITQHSFVTKIIQTKFDTCNFSYYFSGTKGDGKTNPVIAAQK